MNMRRGATETDQARATRALALFYRRSGYVRWQDVDRSANEGSQQYKKGDEVRLIARTAKELRLVRRLLRKAGFRPGRPFRKGRHYRQPVYGRQAVLRFLVAVEA